MLNHADPKLALRADHSLGANPMHGVAYRPDIDGLRALAVIAVVIYHAFPQLAPGGFAGVDIFFVISGYLITGIIDRQLRAKRFSILEFYARRVLRIFPALMIVVIVTFAAGWFLLPVNEMEALGANVKGAAVFIENFVLYGQIVGYFDPGAERLPLLHLWSLGIEEQYYIVWPLTLLLISRWPTQRLKIVLLLGVCSFAACLWTPASDAAWAFYSPTTRGWELLVGSGLALWTPARSVGATRRIRSPLAIAGLTALILTFWMLGARSPWPGVRTMLPVVATAALLGTDDTPVHRLLSARWFVFVGLISYPLYLWHFPLIAFVKLQWDGPLPISLTFGLLAVSVSLAWLTYRFIERPIRFGSAPATWRVAPLVAAMAATWLVGMTAVDTRGLPMRFPRQIQGLMLSGTETSVHWRRAKCLLLLQPASEFASECAGHGGHPLVLVWGDSYGAALYPGLLHFAAERGYEVAQYTASACPPLIGYSLPERPFCKSINDDVLSRIGRLRPDVVVLDATWGHAEPVLREDLPRTVAMLKALSVGRIVLMGPPPSWQGAGLSRNVLDYYRQTGEVLPARSFYRSTDEWTRGRDRLLQEMSRELGIEYISVRDVFCNDDGCLTRIGPNDSELTAFDPGHLTVPGAIYLASRSLDRILGPNGARPQTGSTGTPR